MAKKTTMKKIVKKKSTSKKSAVKKSAAKKKVKKKTSASSGTIKAPTLPKAKASAITGDVEHLMQMMVAHDVTEIDIEDGPRKIVLRRGCFIGPAAIASPGVAAPALAATTPVSETASEEDKSDLIEITSPMVGTFYAAASPDSDPYVVGGANVTDNSVVCIVEAMKVMNEIKAECSGTIAEVCVKNAEPVEFGQVLFRVKPA